MAEFKAITTQEEFDAAISDRLQRQKETIEAKYKDYDQVLAENTTLKQELAENKTALEKTNTDMGGLTSQIEELTGKVNGYELEKMKTTIALQNGIPFSLASRLVGTTEDEILQDAKSLASMVSQTQPMAPLKSTEPVDNNESGYKSLLGNLNLEGE
ncbi:capsid assembly scaffolding protein Gp46 family protein [Peptostreptococcus anaerobius]|uniref:capsid assembly scaffolding protein Gp46 family protein n=1 Tax=Peptostreptococcus anaerobius TaxID=1261 RepID=UPI0034A3FD18